LRLGRARTALLYISNSGANLGSGTGIVSLKVSQNLGPSRSAVVSIAGREITVTQAGVNYPLALPKIAGAGPVFNCTLQPVIPSYAPGQIVSIYGSDLCQSAAPASPPLPDRLGGGVVQLDGRNIRLYYASANQINAVLPQDVTIGTHQLAVQRFADSGYTQLAAQGPLHNIAVSSTAATFLEVMDGGKPVLAARFPDGGFASAARPVTSGDYITLYLTGLGRKKVQFPEGTAPGTTAPSIAEVQVYTNAGSATVLYSGVQPAYPGLDQITLKLRKFTLSQGESKFNLNISYDSTYFTYAISAK
jgi:uncharacterized protein (TIGR03437 family)